MSDRDPQDDEQKASDSQEERIARVMETGQKAGSTKQALKEAKLKNSVYPNLPKVKTLKTVAR